MERRAWRWLALGTTFGAVVVGGAGRPWAQTPPADTKAEESTADAGAQAGAAAALKATQEMEVRLIELQRQLEALERQRASWDDIRRRLDDLEARQQALARSFPDESDFPGGARPSSLRFGGSGLIIRSPGNRFLLRPGLRLQTRYDAQLADPGPVGGARADSSSFALSHAQLILEGHAVSSRFEYRLEVDFADSARGPTKDAFVQWRLVRSVGLRFGQFKVPFGLQQQIWSGYLEFVDLAQPMAAFSLDRDVGLMVVGRPLAGRLQYQLAAVNGPRAPCPDSGGMLTCDKVDLAYAARIVAAPFGPLPLQEGDLEWHARPLLSVGVAASFSLLPTDVRARTSDTAALLDVDGDGRVDNVGVWQAGAELRAVFRGVAVQGEWFGRREHPGTAAADRSYWGAYGQASCFLLPQRLQIAARVGRTDLPLYGVVATDRALRGTTTTEETAALNAYVRGHDAKLQVDYTHFDTSNALSTPAGHRVRAAVQLAF